MDARWIEGDRTNLRSLSEGKTTAQIPTVISRCFLALFGDSSIPGRLSTSYPLPLRLSLTAMVDIDDLPPHLLATVVREGHLDLASVIALAGTCKTLRIGIDDDMCRHAVASAAARRWGAERWRNHEKDVTDDGDCGPTLREAAVALEENVTKLVGKLRFDDALTRVNACAVSDQVEPCEQRWARAVTPLLRIAVAKGARTGRAAAAWVIGMDRKNFRNRALPYVLQRLRSLKGMNVLDALRAVLYQLPFLPMDAGRGANAVIKEISCEYVRVNQSRFGVVERSASEMSRLQDAVHVMLYALIMLNTDLWNSAIKTKITFQQWSEGIRASVANGYFRSAELLLFYDSLMHSPLRDRPKDVEHVVLVRDSVTRLEYGINSSWWGRGWADMYQLVVATLT